MSSAATNAAFRVFSDRLNGKSINRIVCLYDDDSSDEAFSFQRMVRAFQAAPIVQMVQQRDFSRPREKSQAVFVSFTRRNESVELPGLKTISTEALDQNDPMFGFYQETQAHDFELGGVIEWNESIPAQFSRWVLQSLSLVHVHRSFPFEVWNDIASLTENRPLRCLDVGCGPISKLRYGALKGWLHIVGVDPLNDMYSGIIARHGLTAIEKIRPDEIFGGFAEEIDFGANPFELIYSLNALDHTQDLIAAVEHMGDSLSPGGLAYIQVYTCEGERQNYEGLHKFNIWIEDQNIMYNSKNTNPEILITSSSDLRLEKIYKSDERDTGFLLRRKY